MYQSFSHDFFPEQIGDLVWATMLREHEEYWDNYRDEHGEFIGGPFGDNAYCYRENGPDGSEYEYELQCFVHQDPSWITPSLLLA